MSHLVSEDQMTTPEKKVRDHRGQKNPHFGHKMQPSSREAIAQSQRARYDLLRQAIERATDDNRIRQVVREELRKLINESKPVNNKPNNIPI